MKNPLRTEAAKRDLPYCLEAYTRDGLTFVIPLNRQYKMLGTDVHPCDNGWRSAENIKPQWLYTSWETTWEEYVNNLKRAVGEAEAEALIAPFVR